MDRMRNLKKVRESILVVLVMMPGTGFSQPASRSGQQLFTHYCAVCHGSTGEGASGPDLTNPLWQSSITDQELGNTVRNGIRGTAMPAFSARLQPAEVQLLIEHLRTLAKDAIQPANDLRARHIAVSPERLLRAETDPSNWLMYGRDYGNQRFSPLEAIHRENVRNLVPVWSFQTGVADGLEATPLYVDGVIFLSTSWNHMFAIDARTGAELWHYRRHLPAKLTYCCGPVNRGRIRSCGNGHVAARPDHRRTAADAHAGERLRWHARRARRSAGHRFAAWDRRRRARPRLEARAAGG